MTAEVAILNTGAVALAADSAVTVSSQSGAKVYNTVNKLFSLSHQAPVGVMIWGGAELCGIPWEVLIKEYRRELGTQRFDTLEEYCENLREFIAGSHFITDELQRAQVSRAAFALFAGLIVEEITRRMHEHFEQSGTASRQQVVSTISALLAELTDDLEKRSLAIGFAARDASRMVSRYRQQIDEVMASTFEKLPLGEASRRKIRRVFGLFCTRDFPSPSRSGLVVAGFGDEDIFPKVISQEIDGYWLDRPKLLSRDSRSVDPSSPAVVIPFAQREMVSLFMEGVDPNYRRVVQAALEGFVTELPELIADAVEASGAVRTKLTRLLTRAGHEVAVNFRRHMAEYSEHMHIRPIIEAVAALPKDELGAMAESLVNLTSFKRRVTLDAETVGGAIDVAVISKGDGFIWLQRKHYFEATHNPQFMARYR